MCGSHWHFLQGMYGGATGSPAPASKAEEPATTRRFLIVPKMRLRQRPGYTGR